MTRRAGFSLLELLVALALLALIGAGLAGALRLGVETFDRARALDDGTAEIAARAQLRRLLSRATSPALLTRFPTSLVGDERALSFVTLAPLGFASGSAAVRVDLDVESDAVRYSVTLLDDDGVSGDVHDATLVSDTAGGRLNYFDGEAWLPTWTSDTQLPRLVTLSVDGETTRWPEFTVELLYAE